MYEYSIPYNAFCGALAGVIAISVVYPTDLLVKMMHIKGTSPDHQYKSNLDLIKQIYNKEGTKGFYRGFNCTLAKIIPMNMIMFVINE